MVGGATTVIIHHIIEGNGIVAAVYCSRPINRIVVIGVLIGYDYASATHIGPNTDSYSVKVVDNNAADIVRVERDTDRINRHGRSSGFVILAFFFNTPGTLEFFQVFGGSQQIVSHLARMEHQQDNHQCNKTRDKGSSIKD